MHNNNIDKNDTVYHKLGQIMGLIISMCVSAIIIALTVKVIMWIL